MLEHEQRADTVVDIASWQLDGYFATYPEGTRDKTLLISPKFPPMAFLLGNHRYLFKHSSPRYPSQFWCEIVAYRVGCMLEVPVPPAFAAWNSTTNRSAALIQWFYRLDEDVRYESGTNQMKRKIPDFDVKKGRQHNIETVLAVLAEVGPRLIENMARILVFDALIGNTDRHQENWGLLWRGNALHPELAPAFDNGTSLGHEILDGKIVGHVADAKWIKGYLHRGRHHMRWSPTGDQCGHFALIAWLLGKYPELRQDFLPRLEFDIEALGAWLATLPKFNIPNAPSSERVQFMENLLRRRLEIVRAIFNGEWNDV